MLIGAGLLFASFRKVLAVDPGFTTKGVLTGAVSLPSARYADAEALGRFTDEACAVCAHCLASERPARPTACHWETVRARPPFLRRDIRRGLESRCWRRPRCACHDGYFEAIGAKLVAGRFFTERDAAGATRVIIVDDRLARRFWPNQNPIGRRMYRPSDEAEDPSAITEKTEFLTVVGVVSRDEAAQSHGRRQAGRRLFHPAGAGAAEWTHVRAEGRW